MSRKFNSNRRCKIIIFHATNVVYELRIFVVHGRYANMLSTDARLGYHAQLQTPYMNTTDMCLELYYQLKSTARFNTPVIEVIAIDEQQNPLHLASSTGANRTSWDRMFAKLPSGFHQIVIEGRRSNTSFCGMSVDDVVVQPCYLFGQLFFC